MTESRGGVVVGILDRNPDTYIRFPAVYDQFTCYIISNLLNIPVLIALFDIKMYYTKMLISSVCMLIPPSFHIEKLV